MCTLLQSTELYLSSFFPPFFVVLFCPSLWAVCLVPFLCHRCRGSARSHAVLQWAIDVKTRMLTFNKDCAVPIFGFLPLPLWFISCFSRRLLVRYGVLQVAINNEVMVAISNMNYAMPGGMLTTWIEGIKRAGVKNAMVVALDAQAKRLAEEHGVTAHEMHLEVGPPTPIRVGSFTIFLVDILFADICARCSE